MNDSRSARCPLCGVERHRESWVGATTYQGRVLEFRECLACRSIFCHPMPDSGLLREMYGSDYGTASREDEMASDSRGNDAVLEWLGRSPPGVFLDYGCGRGALLERAKRVGWDAVGVELNESVAESVAADTGCRVVTSADTSRLEQTADVLHLGDVIEHLTDVDRQMPEVLALLKPGGLLLVQGPLEANANLFMWTVRSWRVLRGSPPRNEPPYHVMLATLEGQEAFFRRFGLSRVEMWIYETAWPAPDRLATATRDGRSFCLYALRRASQAISRRRPGRFGNRYFYAGRT